MPRTGRPPLPITERSARQIRVTERTADQIRYIIAKRNKDERFDDIIAIALRAVFPTEIANYDEEHPE